MLSLLPVSSGAQAASAHGALAPPTHVASPGMAAAAFSSSSIASAAASSAPSQADASVAAFLGSAHMDTTVHDMFYTPRSYTPEEPFRETPEENFREELERCLLCHHADQNVDQGRLAKNLKAKFGRLSEATKQAVMGRLNVRNEGEIDGINDFITQMLHRIVRPSREQALQLYPDNVEELEGSIRLFKMGANVPTDMEKQIFSYREKLMNAFKVNQKSDCNKPEAADGPTISSGLTELRCIERTLRYGPMPGEGPLEDFLKNFSKTCDELAGVKDCSCLEPLRCFFVHLLDLFESIFCYCCRRLHGEQD